MSPRVIEAEESKLLAVLTISRHGRRNRCNFPVTSLNIHGDLQLRQDGREQTRYLGKKIRKTYISLFENSGSSGVQVLPKCSTDDRCFDSVTETVHGLTTGISLGEIPRTLDLKPGKSEVSDRFREWAKAYHDLLPADATWPDGKDICSVLDAHCDNLVATLELGLSVPPQITSKVRERMIEYRYAIRDDTVGDREKQRPHAQPLLTEILAQLEASADAGTPRILIWGSHDVVVGRLMKFLRIMPEGMGRMKFAATLTFELHLHKETQQRFLKIYYTNEVKSFPGDLREVISVQRLKDEMKE